MHRETPTLLLVERDADATQALIAFLYRHGFEIVWVRDEESAFNALDRESISALVVALRAPRIDGLAVLRRARERHPAIGAVAIGASVHGAPANAGELADEAIRLGAADVQSRPVNPDRLLAVLERGLAQQRLAARVGELEERLERRLGFERIEARSPGMRRVIEQVRQVAPTRAPVLIEGEPGSGRSRLAEIIHHHSPRRAGRFVIASARGATPELVEREVFGREGGAGAGDGVEGVGPASGQAGRLELADGGTLLLEHVEAAPAGVQVRLLRLVQDRAFERVGGAATRRADVRLIVSTAADLAAEVRAGRFREDLHARLSVVRMRIPPLRARGEDLPMLAAAFVREFNREHGRRVTGVTPGVLERLAAQSWPGNVRELRDMIEGMVVFAHGRRPLDLSDLPRAIRGPAAADEQATLAPGMTVEEAERALIEATLRHTGYDKTRAAAMLGIGLRTLYRKITRYALAEPAPPR
jgi:DNA-binding NtrC family response regulator